MSTKSTREMVLAKVQRVFPSDDPAEVLSILDLYGAEQHEYERERVQLACLKLSEGNKDALLNAVETAKSDYRDVLSAAEYPGFDRIGFVGVDKLDAEGRRKLIYEDLHQYLSWLHDTDEPDMSNYQKKLQDED